jgi:hypothetical protein
MVADGLLTRQRYREVPPRVDYELTERARDLLPVVGALARWGYEWSWSPPREGEAIDIGAILRVSPGLQAPSRASGTVELTVSGDAGDRPYALTARDGRITIEERAAPDAEAHVSGSEQAWIDALGPEGTRAGLRVDGDRDLAAALLDSLSPNGAAARVAAVA